MKEYSIEDFKTLLKYDDIKSELCKIKCKNCTKTFGGALWNEMCFW